MSKWDNYTIRVAVTGVGGECGQAILKALLVSKLPVEVYPVDITPLAAGLHTGMGGMVLPCPEQSLEMWRKWCINMRINAVIPGSDHDITPLAAVREEWQKDWQIKLLVNPLFAVEVSNDKWLTAKELRACDVDVPLTLDSADVAAFLADFPHDSFMARKMVIKPRFGMASRGVQVIDPNDGDAAGFYWKRTENPILQEYVNGDEFTCGLFFDAQSCLRACFVMRRWLKNGSTHVAEAGDFPDVVQFCHEFAEKTREKFKWQGAVNVQLRQHPAHGCVVFEINARCSGSTAIRAAFGYNEPEMLIRQFVMGEQVEQPTTTKGVALRRMEYSVLDNIAHDTLLKTTRGTKGRRV